VSVSQYAPFGPSVEHDRFVHDGRSFEVNVTRADAGFFATTGARVVRGRVFTAEEVSAEAPVALVSQRVARTFFAGDPVGQSLSAVPAEAGLRQAPATIVGVVADALLTRVEGEAFGDIYRPISRQRSNPPVLLIRAARPSAVARAVEETVRAIDPRVQPRVLIVREGRDDFLGYKERLAWLVAPAALLALLLAALGVYGLTAFVASLRTEEVSVRMALGASAADVLRLLMLDSLRPVAAGLVVGVGLALAFGRLAAQELAGINPHDPVSVAVAAGLLLGCAVAAVGAPAWRAAKADPATLLRQG
jgi:hypothetical protein